MNPPSRRKLERQIESLQRRVQLLEEARSADMTAWRDQTLEIIELKHCLLDVRAMIEEALNRIGRTGDPL